MDTAVKYFPITTHSRRLLADMLTPVSAYQRIRRQFPNSVLLESADYHAMQNSLSFIGCDPVASFVLDDDVVTQKFPDGSTEEKRLVQRKDAVDALRAFAACFEEKALGFLFPTNGLFGHMTYDSVEYFEDIEIQPKSPESAIPQIVYYVYRYVIVFNHFKNEVYLFEHQYGDAISKQAEGLNQLEFLIQTPKTSSGTFHLKGEEQTNRTDDEMREVVNKCIEHCLRGDVFQIVPSRRFSRQYEGDDFQVYRALRSINPSPYLFYFDFGSYRIFGSSPEKQIYIKNGLAEIHPIAGTFRRTGDDERDAELARELLADPKESAEHVMLVDLARNDLSRSSDSVKVETFKEVQYYSHVIHLVSKVVGKMTTGTNPLQLVADTFPAGTLSGAPKHMAMKLINRYETTNRSIYGGAIGQLNFNGDFNHAIAIRTFLSKNHTLFYQAGMGVVAKSNVESELQEIHSKLAALRKAMEMAEEI
ncbi:MAG: anthranilate synthase component I family protein [Siphonobacter sp.]